MTSEAEVACIGHVLRKFDGAWVLGSLQVRRASLAFVPSLDHASAAIQLPWADVAGVRVLSTLAADLEPGCFDVAVAAGASAVDGSPSAETAVGSPSAAQTLARFPGSATTLRFMTGQLSIAADWVGEIDDAVAAAEEGSLEEWWAGVTRTREAPIRLNSLGVMHLGAIASLPQPRKYRASPSLQLVNRAPRSGIHAAGDGTESDVDELPIAGVESATCSSTIATLDGYSQCGWARTTAAVR